MITKENVICPNCAKKLRVKVRSDISSLSFDEIVSLNFLKVTCSKCGENITLSYPFFYENEKFVITFNKEEKRNKLVRVTHTINDFKEKFLILTDELNDIIIELLKDYIHKQTGIDGEIRYEGMTEEYLIFFLFNTKQDVKINLTFYGDLVKNAKFLNKGVIYEVDSENYLNYVRLK